LRNARNYQFDARVEEHRKLLHLVLSGAITKLRWDSAKCSPASSTTSSHASKRKHTSARWRVAQIC